jgi:hypothetical protein
MSHKLKKYIWYQIEGRQVNYVEQPSGQYIRLCREIKREEALRDAPSTLVLSAKRTNETEYTTLDANFFSDVCGNEFDRLISKFDIKQRNPIKVTLPGMFLSLHFVCFSWLASLRSYHGGNL